MTPLDQAEAYLTRSGLIDRSGAVLYSSEETLKPGSLYLLGLNPGGAEGGSLANSIAASRRGHNAYLDEAWTPEGLPEHNGKATLQRRVRLLCEKMGLDVRTVPASNLAFTRSTGIVTHPGFTGAIDLCRPVHEIFMSAIEPAFVMTFGNIGHFKRVMAIEECKTIKARHAEWKAHRGTAVMFGQRVAFGNVPHMSLWASDYRDDVVDWVIEHRK